jgi:hypothetical protein
VLSEFKFVLLIHALLPHDIVRSSVDYPLCLFSPKVKFDLNRRVLAFVIELLIKLIHLMIELKDGSVLTFS